MFKFLKRLWDIIRVVLVVVLLCLAVWFAFTTGSFMLLGMTLSGLGASLLCVGVAYIVDPGSTVEALTAVATAAAEVATSVASAALDVVTSAVGSSSLLLYGAIGFGAYLLLSGGRKVKKDGKPDETIPRDFVGPLEAGAV